MGRRGCGCCGCKTLNFPDFPGEEYEQFEPVDPENPPNTFGLYVNPDPGYLGLDWHAIELQGGTIKPIPRLRRQAYLISFNLFGQATVEVEGYKCHIDTINGAVSITDPNDVEVLLGGKPMPAKSEIGTFGVEALVNIYVSPTHLYVYAEDLYKEGYPYSYNVGGYFSAMIVAEDTFNPSGLWTIGSDTGAIFQNVKVTDFQVRYSSQGTGGYYGYNNVPKINCRQTRRSSCDFESFLEMKTAGPYGLKPYEGWLDMDYTGEIDVTFAGSAGRAKYPLYDQNGKNPYEEGYDQQFWHEYIPIEDIGLPKYDTEIGGISAGGQGACLVAKGVAYWNIYQRYVSADPNEATDWVYPLGTRAVCYGSIQYDFPEPTYNNPYPPPRFRVSLLAENAIPSQLYLRASRPDGSGGFEVDFVEHQYVTRSESELYVAINEMRNGFSITTGEPTADEYILTDPAGMIDDPSVTWAFWFNFGWQPLPEQPHFYENIGASGYWSLF